ARGQGRDRGEKKTRVGADGHGDRKRFALLFGDVIVEASALLDLPVHAGLARAEDVHAIETEVSLAASWIGGEGEGEGDEEAAVLGAGEQGEEGDRILIFHHS